MSVSVKRWVAPGSKWPRVLHLLRTRADSKYFEREARDGARKREREGCVCRGANERVRARKIGCMRQRMMNKVRARDRGGIREGRGA